jgi:hypothetical protein
MKNTNEYSSPWTSKCDLSYDTVIFDQLLANGKEGFKIQLILIGKKEYYPTSIPIKQDYNGATHTVVLKLPTKLYEMY